MIESKVLEIRHSRLVSIRDFWKKYGTGYLFLLPAVLLYSVFVFYPFLGSIDLSLRRWDGADPVREFVGLSNYVRMVQDDLFWLSLGHNLIWMVIGTIVPIGIALFLAVLLWSQPWGFTVFRTAYFMPQVIAPVVIGIIWGWIYDPRFGILNRILEGAGLDFLTQSWLANPQLALYAVIAAWMWAHVGFHFIIILAGLQNVQVDLLEAATLDGANAWQKFWHVTIPQLAHVLTLTSVLALISAFKVFDLVFIMTDGGPANRTELIATYTYEMAFVQSEVGYAATLAMAMTVLALIGAILLIRIREGGEE